MKASLILIRAVFVLTAIFGFLFGAKAEIFIGSSTNVNSLVVASNEVILISAIRNENFYSYYSGEINLNGTTQEVAILNLTSHKYALAEPAILSFPYISFPNLWLANKLVSSLHESLRKYKEHQFNLYFFPQTPLPQFKFPLEKLAIYWRLFLHTLIILQVVITLRLLH